MKNALDILTKALLEEMEFKFKVLDYTVSYFLKNGKDTYTNWHKPFIDESKITSPDAWIMLEAGAFDDEALHEEFQDLEHSFWLDVKRFHDNPLYWGKDSLTVEGIEALAKLKAEIIDPKDIKEMDTFYKYTCDVPGWLED